MEPKELWLTGHITPKARPRLDPKRGRGYTEPRYRAWLDAAIDEIALQVKRNDLVSAPLAVTLNISEERTRIILMDPPPWAARPKYVEGDIDNITGSVFDALQKGGAIGNDKLIVAQFSQFGLDNG